MSCRSTDGAPVDNTFRGYNCLRRRHGLQAHRAVQVLGTGYRVALPAMRGDRSLVPCLWVFLRPGDGFCPAQVDIPSPLRSSVGYGENTNKGSNKASEDEPARLNRFKWILAEHPNFSIVLHLFTLQLDTCDDNSRSSSQSEAPTKILGLVRSNRQENSCTIYSKSKSFIIHYPSE